MVERYEPVYTMTASGCMEPVMMPEQHGGWVGHYDYHIQGKELERVKAEGRSMLQALRQLNQAGVETPTFNEELFK